MLGRIKQVLAVIAAILFSAALPGCQTLHYYSQAIEGQCRILLKRQSISEIMADSGTPQILREKLMFVLTARKFAKNELQLPVNNHYLTYVDLKRPFVVWNVIAAPEFSLVPKTWCYPIVGCAAYRGYFSEMNARQYADTLSNRGYDVYVGGVTAYSTLGWFEDPVFNTFIRLSEARLAALIFHELAHQILYVADDTVFNESFATAVEQEGLRRWQNKPGNSRIYAEYLPDYERQQQFIRLIMKYRRTLEGLYQTDLPPTEKREKKASVYSRLRKEYETLKAARMGLSVYDPWLRQPLNNAHVISVVAYHDFVPAFDSILAENDGDLNQFYQACQHLAKKKKDERNRILDAYLRKEPEPIIIDD